MRVCTHKHMCVCHCMYVTPPLAKSASSGPGRSLWLSGAAEFPLPQSSGVSPCAPPQPSTTISQIYAGPPSYARTLLQARRVKKKKNNLAVKLSDSALKLKWVIHNQILFFCHHHKIQSAQTFKLKRDIYWWDLGATATLHFQSPFQALETRLLYLI